MHPDYLSYYMSEIVLQHRYADIARTEINSLIAIAHDEQRVDASRFYLAAQTLLTCGAQISKLLWVYPAAWWPVERVTVAQARSAALLKALEPDEILSTRSVRNSVEHFDERLDVKIIEMLSRGSDQSAGPLTVVSDFDLGFVVLDEIGAPNATLLRNINPTNLTYTALDEEISLLQLMAAIDDVARRATEWLTAHEPPPITPEEIEELRPVLEQFDMLDLGKTRHNDVAKGASS